MAHLRILKDLPGLCVGFGFILRNSARLFCPLVYVDSDSIDDILSDEQELSSSGFLAKDDS